MSPLLFLEETMRDSVQEAASGGNFCYGRYAETMKRCSVVYDPPTA